MKNINITLIDGSIKKFSNGTTLNDVVQSIDSNLAKKTLVAKINGKTVDLSYKLDTDAQVEFLTFNDEEGKNVLRHSASHILAQAIKRLYKNVKLGVGSIISDGYYYDFDIEYVLKLDDLLKIEEEMAKIINENLIFEKIEINRDEALMLFKSKDEAYKSELIRNLPNNALISIYKQGEFVDLCIGPHVYSTGKLKIIKLQSLTGAYWRGNCKQKMLQRVHGTVFEKKAELDKHLKIFEEISKRDHRKLGKELDLFSIQKSGPGFPFFHFKGMIIRRQLEDFWYQLHNKYKYQEIKTPLILNQELWQQSGHWNYYKENMYFTNIDNENYAVKPMNCPGAILIYRNKQHSYREFPIRICELGIVHRHELSGTLHGLMRARCFTQDDAHIFMLPSQILNEIKNVIDLFDSIYSIFGLSYYTEISTKPENAMGNNDVWEIATNSLKEALECRHLDYKINKGGGAFYGPKVDFHLKDSIGRTWQCGTIQLDMLMPEKFDLNYIGEDGKKYRPVMIHRVVYGSIERFLGILIEHFAGFLPIWLAPVQVKLLPIFERNINYAKKLAILLEKQGIRTELDERSEKIGYKIRAGQIEKIPYMLIIGDKEEKNNNVSVWKRGEGDKGVQVFNEFMIKTYDQIISKEIF